MKYLAFNNHAIEISWDYSINYKIRMLTKVIVIDFFV